MEEELKKELLKAGEDFNQFKKTKWQPEDLKIIFIIYNKIAGENLINTGCKSCIRETIKYVYDQWVNLVKID